MTLSSLYTHTPFSFCSVPFRSGDGVDGDEEPNGEGKLKKGRASLEVGCRGRDVTARFVAAVAILDEALQSEQSGASRRESLA